MPEREVVGGHAVGWRSVGTVCLRCGHVVLDKARLPPELARGPAWVAYSSGRRWPSTLPGAARA